MVCSVITVSAVSKIFKQSYRYTAEQAICIICQYKLKNKSSLLLKFPLLTVDSCVCGYVYVYQLHIFHILGNLDFLSLE